MTSLLGGEHDHHHHNNKSTNRHVHHHHQPAERDGRAVSPTMDFSSAVFDPVTGLRCLQSQQPVVSYSREKLLSCTHSKVTVCHYTYTTQVRGTVL